MLLGASGLAFTQVVQSYGLNARPLYSLEGVANALANGRAVLAIVGAPYTFVGATHAVVLHQNSNGNTYISDPYGNRVSGWHSIADIWGHQSQDSFDRRAGYVFVEV
ncbi:MAG: hypothetical protein LBS33_01290 [Streptococcaceae bacterium]|nr:hypothetical protein [Streptococcaceae bacterium]